MVQFEIKKNYNYFVGKVIGKDLSRLGEENYCNGK